VNDKEEHFILNGFEGIDLDMFKLYFVIICWWYCNCARNRSVKHGLFLLENYCVKWKLTVNATETKVMKG